MLLQSEASKNLEKHDYAKCARKDKHAHIRLQSDKSQKTRHGKNGVRNWLLESAALSPIFHGNAQETRLKYPLAQALC